MIWFCIRGTERHKRITVFPITPRSGSPGRFSSSCFPEYISNVYAYPEREQSTNNLNPHLWSLFGRYCFIKCATLVEHICSSNDNLCSNGAAFMKHLFRCCIIGLILWRRSCCGWPTGRCWRLSLKWMTDRNFSNLLTVIVCIIFWNPYLPQYDLTLG